MGLMRTIICLVLVKESSLKEEAYKMRFKGLKLTPGLLPRCLPRSWGTIPVTGLCTNVPSYMLVVSLQGAGAHGYSIGLAKPGL